MNNMLNKTTAGTLILLVWIAVVLVVTIIIGTGAWR